MFIGTERAFRGYSLIFFIYGFGCFLATLIISQLTQAHLDVEPLDPNYDDIENKKKQLIKVLLILGSVFGGISITSFLLKIKYSGVKGISAQEAKDRKQFKRL